MRFFAAQTKSKDVVSIEGSVLGGKNMLLQNKSKIPELAAELFDAGTSKKTKDEIREALSSRGAAMSFFSTGDRICFLASCLPEDVSFVLELIVECISDSTFPVKELRSAKERMLAELSEEEHQTHSLAAAALSRLIYEPSHVNYIEKISERKKSVELATRADLLSFKKMLGKEGLVLAITGDISPTKALKSSRAACVKLPKGTVVLTEKKINTKPQKALSELITVKDKANVDVYLGTSISLRYTDSLYVPFTIICEMLGGGGFTSHLMQTVRERDGLTYGVYASGAGFAGEADGYFRVKASFSPNRFSESVKVLKKEIAFFFAHKITAENLTLRKTEMIGEYVVGLSTSKALASMLHKIGIEHKKVEYIDEYPEIVKNVALKDLKKAAELISVETLSLAAAGTFPKKV